MADVDPCAVDADAIAMGLQPEALVGFVESNQRLFVEYVRGWYPAYQAEAILAQCVSDGILHPEYGPDDG